MIPQQSCFFRQALTNVAQTNSWLTIAQVFVNGSYLWIDTNQPVTGRRFYRAVPEFTNMVWIPPGTFMMGSPISEGRRRADETIHSVTLTKGFYIGRFAVTQGEYTDVIGSNPSNFKDGSNYPVEEVTWVDATNYCARLTQREQTAGRLPAGWQYRLPTEAEWEYACRAGTTTPLSYGDDPTYAQLGQYAWYNDNSFASTHPVGEKLPNPWGLYDMYGNVMAWCQDWYGPYPNGPVTDPQGGNSGFNRVLRGSAFYDPAGLSRSAYRSDGGSPTGLYFGFGIRVVLAPEP